MVPIYRELGTKEPSHRHQRILVVRVESSDDVVHYVHWSLLQVLLQLHLSFGSKVRRVVRVLLLVSRSSSMEISPDSRGRSNLPSGFLLVVHLFARSGGAVVEVAFLFWARTLVLLVQRSRNF